MKLNYRLVNGIIPGKVYGEYSSPNKVMTLPEEQEVFGKKQNGYRGCWHRQEPMDPEYGYKYSGGLGTYSCKHSPMAVYSPEAHKTFFVWGGAGSLPVASEEQWDFSPEMIYHMVSYYDHKTGMVPKPTVVLDKYCGDAHDNPVICLDKDGYIWVFSPSHGEWTTRSYIHRSTEPYSIHRFETVSQNLFAYPQVHYASGRGFLFMHTNYNEGRGLRVAQSSDGRSWSAPADLARFGQGHYQVSRYAAGKLGSAFDYHPQEGGLDYRTNLYYMESADGGASWTTVLGRPLTMPLLSSGNPALVRDYEAEGLKVYLKDIQYDSAGRPAILYITSRGWQSGPDYGPRTWRLARWTGSDWAFSRVAESGNNYDHGSLYIEPDGTYRIIGPTEDGPEKWNPGGEVALWESRDEGWTWSMKQQLTSGSRYNHTYVRSPVGAHPDFYAYWADGATAARSESRLYFCNRAGEVFRLPFEMNGEFAVPEKV
jgi:hypothetical protein